VREDGRCERRIGAQQKQDQFVRTDGHAEEERRIADRRGWSRHGV
jgi:hypothetical protein